MTRINLLPWREALRKQRQQQFYVTSVSAILVMLGVVALVHLHFAGEIDHQSARNRFLEGEISAVDKRIAEIKDLEREKADLLARMNIIQQLQRQRPEVVHVFDEMVTTLPEGVYLTNIKNRGSAITFNGVAQSNARVSSYMRNIESSEWLTQPQLNIIQREEKEKREIESLTQRANNFILTVAQKSLANAENTEEGQ